MKQALFVIIAFTLVNPVLVESCSTKKDTVFVPPRLLVFTKTAGFRHESIPDGVAALQKMATDNRWEMETTADASLFTEEGLKKFRAVIFLSTTGDVFNEAQQAAFERYVQGGGGFVGIHAAADMEYDWPWYNRLVGAYFLNHPQQQKAVVIVKDKSHPSTSFLPDRWERFDEWYNFKNIMPHIKVLATLDESTYQGGRNGDNHPIAWYHEVTGGRAFYTGLGHTKESFNEPFFLRHLQGGISYVLGQ